MTAVLVFVRAPRAGQVKTRLAREVGSAHALAAYRSMGRSISDAVAARYPLTVWYTPVDGEACVREWLGPHRYKPQVGGDLGARLAHAFDTHFAAGDRPVIAIGADVPSLTAAVVAEAEHALGEHAVVLGPSLDGGFYLIGLRAPAPAVFVDVPWGGTEVMRITVARCHTAGLSIATLAPRRDVDTAADLAAEGVRVP